MLKGKTVAVVVPAYNEETQIIAVLESMPEFVDRIVVVDDRSKDNTAQIVSDYISKLMPSSIEIKENNEALVKTKFNKAERVSQLQMRLEKGHFTPIDIFDEANTAKSRVILLKHKENASVGAAIASGYRWCRDHGIDCTAVMAGDGQMDPDELESICLPVVEGEVDYVKGNRLSHRSAFFVIPKIRYFGNSILSLLTKIASGYWRVSDTQTGYTAISLRGLKAIRLHQIYKSYGCPNDILVKLNIAFCTLKEVPIKPIYAVGEQSKMKIFKVIPRISFLLFKAFWKRLYVKYLFRDFHPLFLLYHLSFFLLIMDIPFIYEVLISMRADVTLPMQSLIIFVFLTTIGLQSLFFAMWMDMTDNERYQKS